MTGQGLQIHDFVLYSASKARWMPVVSSSNLGQRMPGVSKSSASIHTYPLFALVTPGRLPALADFRHLVDEGWTFPRWDPLSHHRPARGGPPALGLPLPSFSFSACRMTVGELANSLAVSGKLVSAPPSPVCGTSQSIPGSWPIGLIRPVEYDQAGFLPHQFVNIRVTAGDRDAGVYDLRHQIHQFEIRLDLPPGFGHMARIPLNIHAFTLYRIFLVLYTMLRYLKGARREKVPGQWPDTF